MADAADGLPGDSGVQREAEAAMLALLSAELGVDLASRKFDVGEGARAEVDGVSLDPRVLAEAWAHQGPPRPAQKAKVLTDAFKLVWLEQRHLPGARKILLFSDDAAARHFRGRTWAARAITDLGVELRVVELPEEMRARIRAAQARQYR
jgi:hypothetical protein